MLDFKSLLAKNKANNGTVKVTKQCDLTLLKIDLHEKRQLFCALTRLANANEIFTQNFATSLAVGVGKQCCLHNHLNIWDVKYNVFKKSVKWHCNQISLVKA